MPTIDLGQIVQESLLSSINDNKDREGDMQIQTENTNDINNQDQIDENLIEPVRVLAAGVAASKFLSSSNKRG